MPLNVVMPKLSETMKDGKLLYWCVQPGDYVEAGEPLAEIEADKANMELEATASGTVTELLAKPGQTVDVGQALAVLEEGVGTPGQRAPRPAQEAAPSIDLTISPLAARLAAEHGIDVNQVKGSGPGGAITPQDIEAYRDSGTHRG